MHHSAAEVVLYKEGDPDAREQEIVLNVSKKIPEIYFKIEVIVVLKNIIISGYFLIIGINSTFSTIYSPISESYNLLLALKSVFSVCIKKQIPKGKVTGPITLEIQVNKKYCLLN